MNDFGDIMSNPYTELATEFDIWAQNNRAESMANGHWDVTMQMLDGINLDGVSSMIDVGCGNGWLVREFLNRGVQSGIGLDISPEMIEVAKHKSYLNPTNFLFLCEDILNFEFEESSVISSYYTLQFILPSVRQKLVDKIYNALTWGGAFFVFEKTRGPDGRFQDMNTHVYNEYKINQGYSPEEIFNKSRSLTGILEPFSDQGNIEMFRRAGFKDIECIFTNINFKGWICIK